MRMNSRAFVPAVIALPALCGLRRENNSVVHGRNLQRVCLPGEIQKNAQRYRKRMCECDRSDISVNFSIKIAQVKFARQCVPVLIYQ